tara:strand:- start:1132 stop:2070 length:939 start_codon:yes stop_codon:yes gene_type:complete
MRVTTLKAMKKLIVIFFRRIARLLAVSDPLFKFLFKNESLILCYHNVSSNPSVFELRFGLNHFPEVFGAQLDFLGRYFRIEDPLQLGQSRDAGGVYLTFDDGFKGSLTEGVEIMQKNNVKSLHFLNMATVCDLEPYWVSASIEIYGEDKYLDKPNQNWKQEFNKNEENFHPQIVSMQELRKLENTSMVYLGNHLWNHYNVTKLSDDEVIESYKQNENELLKFKNYSGFFAYPFGQPVTCYNNKSNKLIQSISPKAIFTAFPSSNDISETKYFYRYSLSCNATSDTDIKFELIYQKIRSYFYRKFLEFKREKV